MDFYGLEAQDGVRCVWNNFPSTKLTQTRAVLNQGIHYTPFKELDNLATVEYDPLRCKCSAVLNPNCTVDFKTKTWICPFCSSRNQFPPAYAQQMSEQNVPAELLKQYSSIEYIQSSAKQIPNVFIYLIDTCIEQIQLNALRDAIQQSLQFIPSDTYVGLITYGRYVFVHELGFSECPKSYALKGAKNYTSTQIQEMLGISIKNDPRHTSQEVVKRFFLPLSECEFSLNSILDDLQPDPWVTNNQERPQVGTGCALNTAMSLLEACPYQGARVMMFIGNPCSIGPGQVVDVELVQTIRSYLDVGKDNENCKHIKNATKYYQSITQRAIKVQAVIDMYAFSIDQVGLMEMKSCCEKTGGYMCMQEEFNSEVFKESYKKLFDKDQNEELKLCSSAKIDILLSKELKVMGALGSCSSLKKTGPMVAEGEIGQAGTTSWYIGGLDKSTSITFILDLSSNNKEKNTSPYGFVQFQTVYKSGSGKTKLRVTTITRKFADNANIFELSAGFDQEAACAMIARMGCLRSDNEEPIEVLKWLDRTLIRLVCKFAEYKKDDPTSFRLSKEFSLYPQFMYNLRRSHFIQTFGASPDEITFYRTALNRESVQNCLVMIQPALLQYNVNSNQPTPVQLDQSSMKNDVILLLDTYFQTIIWQGPHIKQWIAQGYLEKEEYQYLKELVEAPQEDVKLIMDDRFPVPKFFLTWEGHTKERYLKSRVNPSGLNEQLKESGHYITDDASLKLFMDHLIKLAVTSQQQ